MLYFSRPSLKDGYDVLKTVKNIILQPMTAVSDLREYLYNNNWKIDKNKESRVYYLATTQDYKLKREPDANIVSETDLLSGI